MKIGSTPSFIWEVNTEVPCREILWHVKRSLEVSQILIDKILTLRQFLLLASDDSASRIVIELWWTSQEFYPAGIITTMARHTHISPGG
jgi:hypothetical protein